MHVCSCSTPALPAETDACQDSLHELMQIGMSLARMVHEEAQSAVLPAAEAVVAFERVARAVRRTVRLVRWLEQPVAVRAEEGGRRVRARELIIRAVEDGIDREAQEGEADGLHVEMLERLDSLEFEADVAGRPVAEVVREILDDLGLGAVHEFRRARRRGLEDVAVLHARAAAAPGAAREVSGVRFGLGRAEWAGPMGGDISKLSDAELDRLCGDVGDYGDAEESG